MRSTEQVVWAVLHIISYISVTWSRELSRALTVNEPCYHLFFMLFCNHLRKGLSVPCWTPQNPGLSTSDNRLYLALVRVYDRHAWWWVLCLFRRSGGDPQWRAPDALRSSSAPCLSKHAASAHSGTAQMYVPLLFYFFYFILVLKLLLRIISLISLHLCLVNFCISGYSLGIYLGIELTIILNCYQLFSILAFFSTTRLYNLVQLN